MVALPLRLRNWVLIAGLSSGTLGCMTGHYEPIDENFEFGYQDRRDNTNVYCHGLAVIAGGCDNAKWGGDIIVARGLRLNHSYKWAPRSQTLAGEACYFIIHKTRYLRGPGLQEQNPGFIGPLEEREFETQDPLPNKAFRGSDR